MYVEVIDAAHLTITTPAGTRFTVTATPDGALQIVTARSMFVQWDGDRVCEVHQLRRRHAQESDRQRG